MHNRSTLVKDGLTDKFGLLAAHVVQNSYEAKMPAHTLVMYHYFENKNYAENLIYFINHAILDDVDYVVVISGGCSLPLPFANNIRYVHTPNQGLDFGAYNAGLEEIDIENYQYFVFINCTVRGPFLLDRDGDDWTRLFTDPIDREVKLVGITINSLPVENPFSEGYALFSQQTPPFPHVQTMVFAVDRPCLALLLKDHLFSSVPDAKFDIIVQKEIHLSQLVLRRGWNIACLAPDGRGIDFRKKGEIRKSSPSGGDPWWPGVYFGRSLHPYETVFFKTNRGLLSAAEIDSLCQSQRPRGLPCRPPVPIERELRDLRTPWVGHKLFIRWIIEYLNAELVLVVGSTLQYAAICSTHFCKGRTYYIGSQEKSYSMKDSDDPPEEFHVLGDTNLSSMHDADKHKDLDMSFLHGKIDIMHIDPRSLGISVRSEFAEWRNFVRLGGVAMVYGTNISPEIRRYFDEAEFFKLNLRHSGGLGILSQSRDVLSNISYVFSNTVERGSVRL